MLTRNSLLLLEEEVANSANRLMWQGSCCEFRWDDVQLVERCMSSRTKLSLQQQRAACCRTAWLVHPIGAPIDTCVNTRLRAWPRAVEALLSIW